MRLIDAISLLDNHTKTIRVRGKLIGYVTFEDIVNAPTVDAVEVVRCKDCKWRNLENANCERFRNGYYVQANSFCSWAERRTNETD